jgi:hypothetical protein
VKQAEERLTKAVANTEAECAAQKAWTENKHGPGRPPNFDGRIAEARETQQQAEQELEAARQRQERARQAIREIPEQARAVYQGLIPAAYLENAARKAKQADDRGPLRELAAELRSDSEAGLADLDRGSYMTVKRVAQECADLFQRSSSCVEGRNGHLSLLHHSLHSLRASRLEALTAVHNFFIQRPDGTTAADRFFGAKPADLFEWLLDHLDMPARPARKRPSQSAPTVLN